MCVLGLFFRPRAKGVVSSEAAAQGRAAPFVVYIVYTPCRPFCSPIVAPDCAPTSGKGGSPSPVVLGTQSQELPLVLARHWPRKLSDFN